MRPRRSSAATCNPADAGSTSVAAPSSRSSATSFAQHLVSAATLPWQPLRPGFAIKLLYADIERDVRVQLLRLEPGTVIDRHRHGGAVHAYNLSGQRLLLDSRELVGPGAYVYEPPGNVDSWMAVGTEPVVVPVVVEGTVAYLDEHGRECSTTATREIADAYRGFVAEQVPATC